MNSFLKSLSGTAVARHPGAFGIRRGWLFALIAVVGLNLSFEASAAQPKRIGNGKSIGKQSPPANSRETAPKETAATSNAAKSSNPGNSNPQAQAPLNSAAQSPAAASPAANSARSRWVAPLAGIAAGLGLAALASHFGFAEELGTFLLMVLALIAVMMMVRLYMSRRGQDQPRTILQPSYAYSGIGQEAMVPHYSPPAGGSSHRIEPVVIRPALPAANASNWRIPAEFDVDGFLRQAKNQYVRMQAAHDAGDLAQLREFTTTELFGEIRAEIESRPNLLTRTDIVILNAELLGVDSNTIEHTASVRFHGSLRERVDAAAEAFDEVWNLTKPVDGASGWVLAGVQQLN